MLDFYRTDSPWTDPGTQAGMLEDIPDDIGAIVKSVQGVLIHGMLLWLYELTPSEAQDNGYKVRRTEDLLQRIKSLENTPLGIHRVKEKRLVVNCRQYAVLTCSILRHKGIPARVRAGYALYTWRGKYENHWICEYWSREDQRWVQVDAQIDDIQRELMHISFDTLDMPQDKFVTAGEGWRGYREGKISVEDFGLGGKEGWNAMGWEMVMPNVTCDFMALNKMELLPWDVNPYWEKKQAEMTPEDITLIDQAGSLACQVDNRWAEMRKFWEDHPALRMPEDFRDKE
ncbi:MAG: transglutaminase domain-containing protein [Fidelibacterota bacterium]|nr:MAG: transglutaminase domain-containing protein [Candidatus Neomarinimicrobiota bacterium]